MIKIGKIYTVAQANIVRVCADITTATKSFTLWYETDKAYAAYLCTERCDSFVVMLLPTAFLRGEDIVCEESLSAKLHYQLTQHYIPAITKLHKNKQTFTISAPLDYKPLPCHGAVGTAFSGGIDSFYTMAKHMENTSAPLTHICLFNVGAFEKNSEVPRLFIQARQKMKQFARQYNLSSVWINTNCSATLTQNYFHTELFRNVAATLALQKLFRIYLHSSSTSIENITFLHEEGFGKSALFADLMLSTETCTVYNSGFEMTRVEKLQYLYKFPPSYTWLHPCIFGTVGDKNCGKCLKCLTLGLTLHADDAFDYFKDVFDKKEFLQNIEEHYIQLHRQCKSFEPVRYTYNHLLMHKKEIFLQTVSNYIRKRRKK